MARNRAADADSVDSSPSCVPSRSEAILLLNEALAQIGAPLEDDSNEWGLSAPTRLIETNIRLVRRFLQSLSVVCAAAAISRLFNHVCDVDCFCVALASLRLIG
jgi:hypothetical protein